MSFRKVASVIALSVGLFGTSTAYADGEGEPKAEVAKTAESAKTECSTLMRKAWNRTPSPAEIDGCANLAATKLADEKDVAKRWAYACTSVLSSSHFLTF